MLAAEVLDFETLGVLTKDLLAGDLKALEVFAGDLEALGVFAGDLEALCVFAGDLEALGVFAGDLEVFGVLAGDLEDFGVLPGDLEALGVFAGDLEDLGVFAGDLEDFGVLPGDLESLDLTGDFDLNLGDFCKRGDELMPFFGERTLRGVRINEILRPCFVVEGLDLCIYVPILFNGDILEVLVGVLMGDLLLIGVLISFTGVNLFGD